MKKYIIIILFIFLAVVPSRAVTAGSPTRAAEIMYWGYRLPPAIMGQLPVQGTMAMQHKYIGGKLDYISLLQDSISTSLMQIHDYLQMAACLYSIYYELSEVITNTADLANSVELCPTGIFATMVSGSRNQIWKETFQNIVELSGEIYSIVATGKKNRMTGEERTQKVFEVQRRLQGFNHQLIVLSRMVRYTSLVDVLNEALMKSQIGIRHNHVDIALQCLKLSTFRVREDYVKYRYTTYEGYSKGKPLDGWTLPLRNQ